MCFSVSSFFGFPIQAIGRQTARFLSKESSKKENSSISSFLPIDHMEQKEAIVKGEGLPSPMVEIPPTKIFIASPGPPIPNGRSMVLPVTKKPVYCR